MRVKGKKMRKKKTYNLPNPINSNLSHDAEHTVYIAGTGGGKTSAVKHIGLVPKSAQAVFFDPYRNYADDKFRGQMCHSTSSRAVFLKALVIARRRGESFKLAYVPSKGATSDDWRVARKQPPSWMVKRASCFAAGDNLASWFIRSFKVQLKCLRP